MKAKTLLLFLALNIIFPSVSNSQGYILRRALNRQVENALDTVLDKKVQEARNKAREKEKKDRAQSEQARQNTGDKPSDQDNQSGGGTMFGGLFGNKVNLKYNEVYSFNSRIYNQMEIYNKNDVTKIDYYIYFSKNSPSAGIETKTINTKDGDMPVTTQMIMDGEHKCFLILTDINGMKMGMISEVPDSLSGESMGKDGENVNPPGVTKTGNTKVISGYRCDEYIYKEPDSHEYSKMWFTKDAVFNFDKRAWTQSGMPSYYGYSGFGNGVIMAWESYDKDNKLTAKSEVKEIDNNFSHSISVDGYTIRQIDSKLNQKNK